jgi:23S rRNA (adenine2503-C2)-methyltransferase
MILMNDQEIPVRSSGQTTLFGLTMQQLEEVAALVGLPRFAGRQMADWLYKKHVTSIDQMTNLSAKGRAALSERYRIGTRAPVRVSASTDGTKKYLYVSGEKQYIEAAYIPDRDRATLCVSSQTGCKMGCLFCMTGKQGFQGNLSAGEIVNQLISLPERDTVTNIVFMGMGEPFDNLEEVLRSLDVLTSDWGLAMSPRRITVSTIGIIPAMREFLDRSQCHLAVSMHTPFDDERRSLMPVQQVYPIAEVVESLKSYDFSGQRRVSFEYIMFNGINDTPRHAHEIVRLLHGISCRVNLIRFHPIPGTPLKGSPDERIIAFRDLLTAKGVHTTIRASRGLDIQAACGLLSTKGI